MNEKKNIIKVILLGNTDTGKTSLIHVYEGKEFTDKIVSNIGSLYTRKEMIINEKKYIIQIWDTAGQEKYRSVNKVYIKGSNIVIFVYDVTNKNSFIDLSDFWVDYVHSLIGKDIIIGVLGNKTDLVDKIKVEKEEAEKYAREIGAFFRETSAKEEPEGFKEFIEQLINEYITKYRALPLDNDNSFNIKQPKRKDKVEENNNCC